MFKCTVKILLQCSLILSCKLVIFAATQVSWKVFMKLSWKLPYKKWLFKKFSWKVLWKFHEKFTWKYHEQLHESIMNSFKKFSRKVGIFRGLSRDFHENFPWKCYDIIYMILSKNIATEFLLWRRAVVACCCIYYMLHTYCQVLLGHSWPAPACVSELLHANAGHEAQSDPALALQQSSARRPSSEGAEA